MSDIAILQSAGAQPRRPNRFVPMVTQTFFTGLVTQRSVFNSPDNRYYRRFLGQRTDILLDGQNVELTNRGTLIRRPGSLQWTSATLSGKIDEFYSFRQFRPELANPIDVIADTSTNFYKITPSAATKIFAKSAGAGQTFFQGIGNTLYSGNGVDQIAWADPNAGINGIVNTNGTAVTWVSGAIFGVVGVAKWVGQPIIINAVTYTIASVTSSTALVLTSTAGVQNNVPYTFLTRNWGIAPGAWVGSGGGATGPNNCSVGADVAVDGGAVWTNPGNITAADSVYATDSTATNATTSTADTFPTAAASTQAFPGATYPWTAPQNAEVNDGVYTFVTLPATAPNAISQSLFVTGYGFNIPANATILGVTAKIAKDMGNLTSQIRDYEVTLAGVAGSPANRQQAATGWATNTPTTVTYGSTSDMWGVALTPSIVNSSAFGLKVTVTATGPPGNGQGAQIDYVTISITYVTPGSVKTDYLYASGYGFGIAASATLQGIAVSLIGLQNAGNPAASSLSVQLIKNGALVGTAITGVQLGTSNGTLVLGGNTSLWGTTWSGTDVNSASFGVYIQGTNSAGGVTTASWSIDAVQVTIYGTGGATVAVAAGAGTMSAVNGGYNYVIAYGNSNSGHVGSSTPYSGYTGNFTNKASVDITLVASPDPQINQIWIFRTKDGGSVYYNLPNSPQPNAVATFHDSNNDSTLTVTSLQAPFAPFNNPPPAGLGKMCYHAARMWGVVGNSVYFSGGPDTLTGNGNEAWPPANVFVFPAAVNRLLPQTAGLLVFSGSDLYIIYGTGITTFYPDTLFEGMGLASYNAIDPTGSKIFLYTADRQFVTIEPSGVNELGAAIGDQLEQFYDPTKVYVEALTAGTRDKAVFIADGTSKWYRCNWNQPPEGGPAWSPQAVFADGVTAIGAVETAPGIHQLLMGRSDGKVLNRQLDLYTDLGAAYAAYFVIGSLVLAAPSQLAEVESFSFEWPNVGTVPSVSVLLDEINGTFEPLPNSVDDPPTLAPSLTVMAKRFYLSQGATPSVCRHLQVRVDLPTDTNPYELLTHSVFGALLARD